MSSSSDIWPYSWLRAIAIWTGVVIVFLALRQVCWSDVGERRWTTSELRTMRGVASLKPWLCTNEYAAIKPLCALDREAFARAIVARDPGCCEIVTRRELHRRMAPGTFPADSVPGSGSTEILVVRGVRRISHLGPSDRTVTMYTRVSPCGKAMLDY